MGPEKVDTRPIQQPFIISLHFTFPLGDFAIFFFVEFIQADQECLTFERLDLLVSFHFTELLTQKATHWNPRASVCQAPESQPSVPVNLTCN